MIAIGFREPRRKNQKYMKKLDLVFIGNASCLCAKRWPYTHERIGSIA